MIQVLNSFKCLSLLISNSEGIFLDPAIYAIVMTIISTIVISYYAHTSSLNSKLSPRWTPYVVSTLKPPPYEDEHLKGGQKDLAVAPN